MEETSSVRSRLNSNGTQDHISLPIVPEIYISCYPLTRTIAAAPVFNKVELEETEGQTVSSRLRTEYSSKNTCVLLLLSLLVLILLLLLDYCYYYQTSNAKKLLLLLLYTFVNCRKRRYKLPAATNNRKQNKFPEIGRWQKMRIIITIIIRIFLR